MANEAKRMCPPDTADYDTARRPPERASRNLRYYFKPYI